MHKIERNKCCIIKLLLYYTIIVLRTTVNYQFSNQNFKTIILKGAYFDLGMQRP